MKLTFGELTILVDTLSRSLSFVNWTGFGKREREELWLKLVNDTGLSFELEVEKSES